MRMFKSTLLIFLLAASAAGYAQTTLAGKWHGAEGNLPTIDLDVEHLAGHPAGNVVFYLLKSNSDGSNAHVDGHADGPKENLHNAPDQISFDVRHKDGTVVEFRVLLDDANHATLVRGEDGARFPLTRVAK
jgi:hypothetical protein